MLAAKYINLAQVAPEIFTTYAIEFRNGAWASRDPKYVADYEGYRDWSSSDNLSNVFMGMKFLDFLYGQSSFHLFNLDYKADDMIAPMREFVAALHSKYPHVPDVVLLTYATEYVKNPANRTYQQRKEQRSSWFDPIDIDIPSTPLLFRLDGLTKDLVLPEPENVLDTSKLKDLQRIYLTMRAIEEINAKPKHAVYITPVASQRPAVSFQDTINKALKAVGNADRLLLKCGVDIANVASPTQDQIVTLTIAQKLRAHNPTYTEFLKVSNGARPLPTDQQGLFEQFRVDFVFFNQDIVALQAKIDATSDGVLKAKYNKFLTAAETLRDQMNTLIITQRTTDLLAKVELTEKNPITSVKGLFDLGKVQDIALEKGISPIGDLLIAQANKVHDDLWEGLGAIESISQALKGDAALKDAIENPKFSEENRLAIIKNAIERLNLAKISKGAETTESLIKILKQFKDVICAQVKVQLTIDWGVQNAATQRIRIQVNEIEPSLWTDYLVAGKDPIPVILNQLQDDMSQEIMSSVPGIDNVRSAITDLQEKYIKGELEYIKTSLGALYTKYTNPKFEIFKVYADVIVELRRKMVFKQTVDAKIEKWVPTDPEKTLISFLNEERVSAKGYEKDVWTEEITKRDAQEKAVTKAQKYKERIDAEVDKDVVRLLADTPTSGAIDLALKELQDRVKDVVQGSAKDIEDAAKATKLLKAYMDLIDKNPKAVKAVIAGLNDLHSRLEAIVVFLGVIPKLEVKITAQNTLNQNIINKVELIKQEVQANNSRAPIDIILAEAQIITEVRLKIATDNGDQVNIPILTGVIKKLQQEIVDEKIVTKKTTAIQKAAQDIITSLLITSKGSNIQAVSNALEQLKDFFPDGEGLASNKAIHARITLLEQLYRDAPSDARQQPALEVLQGIDALSVSDAYKDNPNFRQLSLYLEVINQLQKKITTEENNKVAVGNYKIGLHNDAVGWQAKIEKVATIQKALVAKNNVATEQASSKDIEAFNAVAGPENKILATTTNEQLIALYDQVLAELTQEEQHAFDQSAAGKVINNSSKVLKGDMTAVYNVLVAGPGAAGEVANKVGSCVWDALDAMGFKKENFSQAALVSIASIVTGISGLLVTIQNNQHMTAEEKKKAQDAAFKAGLMDIANIAIADQTGASADTIATEAGFNRIINILVPNEPSAYSYNSAATTSGDYMGNLNKFKTSYEELEQKQAEQQPSLAISAKKSSNRYESSSYGSSYSSPYSAPSSYSSSLYPSTYPSIDDLMAIAA